MLYICWRQAQRRPPPSSVGTWVRSASTLIKGPALSREHTETMRVHRESEREREKEREKESERERKSEKERKTEHCSRAIAERLGVLTMDIHSPRANTWTLEQHPAFDRFTNQPTTFAVRPRHQPRSSSLSILYPLNVRKR